ncbi:Phospholipase/carboxylesterase/thioesterase [Penicillium occitanis (nom. inval.)]|nr:Phospholipase/carboxylesterase/thioesterase [Penicillium occitanis (nom. inval.)]PCG90068.1 hypothetical protein PENOC_103860 [Penicillium occitanis (nom. inval.)]
MAAPWNPLMHEETYVRRRAVPNSHTSSVVFCHASGQQGSDWLYIVDQLRSLARLDHVAFVFPYLSYDGKAASPASNVQLIQTIVAEEIKKGILPGRIALGGMGEGAAVALSAVLSDPTKIAGVAGLALAGADDNQIIARRAPTQAQTPVLIASRVTQETAAMGLGEKLQRAGQPVEVIAHKAASLDAKSGLLSQQEVEDLGAFFQKVLPVEK